MKKILCFLIRNAINSERETLEVPSGTTLEDLRSSLRLDAESFFCRSHEDVQVLEKLSPIPLSEKIHVLADGWTYTVFSHKESALVPVNPVMSPPPSTPLPPIIKIDNSSNNSSVHNVNVYVPRQNETKKMDAPNVRPRYLQPNILSAYGLGPSRNATLKQ